jgi:hypothetical protein
MNAILTHTKRIGKTTLIIATSASGKTVKLTPKNFNETEHRQAATQLSIKLGWGSELLGGETKAGFAYIPTKAKNKLTTPELVQLLANGCQQLTPDSQDPIRFASGVETLKQLQDTF